MLWEDLTPALQGLHGFPSGVTVHNPMGVFPNNDGSELVFTVYRRPDMSDQEFAEDAKAVERDLAKLKTLLEK